ncbi:MAG: PilN domain-containing protein [Pseudomonadota bacterium]
MQVQDDPLTRLTGRLSLRRWLTVFANHLEAGAADFAGTPPSRRAPLPVRVVLTGGEVLLEIAKVDEARSSRFEDPATLAEAIRKESVRKVDLILDDGAALDLAFSLPEASFAELRQMIFHEIAYQSPFEAQEARWCWVAVRNGQGDEAGWHVHAAVALAERVEPVLEALRSAGIKVACVRRRPTGGLTWAAMPPWAGGEPAVHTQRSGVGRLGGVLAAAMRAPAAVALPVLATCAFFGFAAAKYVTLSLENMALTEETISARSALAAASRQTVLRRQIEDERFASALRMAALGNVAASLPDDTWISSFAIMNDQFEVAGSSPSAAATSEQLAQVPGLGAITFAAPIARNSRQQTERFRLAAPFASADAEAGQ